MGKIGAWISTKTYENVRCIYREWHSKRPEYNRLRPYSLTIKLVFECHHLSEEDVIVLDDTSEVLIGFNQWLDDKFRGKTMVAEDDPELPALQQLADKGLIDLATVPHTGSSKLSEALFHWLKDHLQITGLISRVDIRTVDVTEDVRNSVYYVE